MVISRKIELASYPTGAPVAENFRAAEEKIDSPGEGQILVKNLCMSVDPYMRGRMSTRKSYAAPFALGETMNGGAIGQVLESRNSAFQAGDHVSSMHGWREAYLSDGEGVMNLGAELEAPPSAYLGVLGMPGLTAYVGLLNVGEYKDGDTVFVSAAAGAVGAMVGQIARIKGSRVVGSAGSAGKVTYLRDDLGFDYAFDYHDGEILDHLRKGAPDGLDIYFDNVGGEHLRAALFHMRPHGRIPLCGAISMYNSVQPPPGPDNLAIAIGMQLTLRGFIVSDYFSHLAAFRRDVSAWLSSGELSYQETVFTGIDKAPQAFMELFTGGNIGKMIVRLDG